MSEVQTGAIAQHDADAQGDGHRRRTVINWVLAGLTVQRQAEVCAALKPATLKAVLPGLLAQSGEALRERLPERLQLQFAAEEV